MDGCAKHNHKTCTKYVESDFGRLRAAVCGQEKFGGGVEGFAVLDENTKYFGSKNLPSICCIKNLSPVDCHYAPPLSSSQKLKAFARMNKFIAI